jgi:hypothetical protein
MIVRNRCSQEVVAYIHHAEYGEGEEHFIAPSEISRVPGPIMGDIDGEENVPYCPPGMIMIHEGLSNESMCLHHVSRNSPLELELGRSILTIHYLSEKK